MCLRGIIHCGVCREYKIRLEYKVKDYLSLLLDSLYAQLTVRPLCYKLYQPSLPIGA